MLGRLNSKTKGGMANKYGDGRATNNYVNNTFYLARFGYYPIL
jgi:hypothetical protein